jgi:hypothetical protein
MVSLEFFIDIILPAGLMASNGNEYKECLLGCKGGGYVGLTILPPGRPNLLETSEHVQRFL